VLNSGSNGIIPCDFSRASNAILKSFGDNFSRLANRVAMSKFRWIFSKLNLSFVVFTGNISIIEANAPDPYENKVTVLFTKEEPNVDTKLAKFIQTDAVYVLPICLDTSQPMATFSA